MIFIKEKPMDINEYIKLIDNLNLLIEDLDTSNVESGIEDVQTSINRLRRRIQKAKSTKNLPYKKITVDFYDNIKLTVRSATVKSEANFSGREEFNLIGWDEGNYLILQKNEWDEKVALKLFYKELVKRRSQNGEIRLFYNEDNKAYTGESNRQSSKEEIRFEFLYFE